LMPEARKAQDLELLRWLAAGDEAAFVLFYRRHQGGLYRFAYHMTGNAEAAADIVQETFLVLIRDAGKFDAARGTPAAFLFGVARNQIHRLQEREARYVALPDGASAELPANGNGDGHHRILGPTASAGALANAAERAFDLLAEQEIARELRAAIVRLPEHYREAVTLCDLEGRSYEEAASLLDCPIGTVRSRLRRARDLLAEKLRPASAVAAARELSPKVLRTGR
jgi:RNA polymerase sigma-70 factor, ECF subfamily